MLSLENESSLPFSVFQLGNESYLPFLMLPRSHQLHCLEGHRLRLRVLRNATFPLPPPCGAQTRSWCRTPSPASGCRQPASRERGSWSRAWRSSGARRTRIRHPRSHGISPRRHCREDRVLRDLAAARWWWLERRALKHVPGPAVAWLVLLESSRPRISLSTGKTPSSENDRLDIKLVLDTPPHRI